MADSLHIKCLPVNHRSMELPTDGWEGKVNMGWKFPGFFSYRNWKIRGKNFEVMSYKRTEIFVGDTALQNGEPSLWRLAAHLDGRRGRNVRSGLCPPARDELFKATATGNAAAAALGPRCDWAEPGSLGAIPGGVSSDRPRYKYSLSRRNDKYQCAARRFLLLLSLSLRVTNCSVNAKAKRP